MFNVSAAESGLANEPIQRSIFGITLAQRMRLGGVVLGTRVVHCRCRFWWQLGVEVADLRWAGGHR